MTGDSDGNDSGETLLELEHNQLGSVLTTSEVGMAAQLLLQKLLEALKLPIRFNLVRLAKLSKLLPAAVQFLAIGHEPAVQAPVIKL